MCSSDLNNIEGVTGYRCRTFHEFVAAARNCEAGKIKSIDCRNHGEKFSLENIAPRYEKFFNDVVNINESKGWYNIDDISLYDEKYLADDRGLNSDGTPLEKKN